MRRVNDEIGRKRLVRSVLGLKPNPRCRAIFAGYYPEGAATVAHGDVGQFPQVAARDKFEQRSRHSVEDPSQISLWKKGVEARELFAKIDI